jgi:ferredoxin
MVIVTLQRDKCIGCNYCVEMAPVLIKSVNAKGFYTLKSPDHTIADSCELAAKACPVKIISVKET